MKDERIDRVREIINILDKRYDDPDCTLNYKTPFQLLVATILSAQSTDKNVNKITPDLFNKYPDVYAFATADIEELQQDIYSTGFYKQKARSISDASQDIVSLYNGILPDDIDLLVKLRGVGRKTANVVLGTAFHKPAIIVDTHMIRLSERLNLVPREITEKKDAVKIEFELMKIVEDKNWTKFSHMMVYFGREICDAKKPKHDICPILHLCEYGKQELQKI